MNFGQAIEALKAGEMVQRQGWNGKGMHIYLERGGSALNVELDTKRLDVDIKHLRIDNAQLQYALEQSETIVDDLAQIVTRLVRQLRKANPDNELSEKALDYLKRKEL